MLLKRELRAHDAIFASQDELSAITEKRNTDAVRVFSALMLHRTTHVIGMHTTHVAPFRSCHRCISLTVFFFFVQVELEVSFYDTQRNQGTPTPLSQVLQPPCPNATKVLFFFSLGTPTPSLPPTSRYSNPLPPTLRYSNPPL